MGVQKNLSVVDWRKSKSGDSQLANIAAVAGSGFYLGYKLQPPKNKCKNELNNHILRIIVCLPLYCKKMRQWPKYCLLNALEKA